MDGEPGVVFRGRNAFPVRLTGRQVRETGEAVPEGVVFSRIAQFYAPPQDFFPIPSGVKFFSFQGDVGVLVVELEPGVRQVRWVRGFRSEDWELRSKYSAPYDDRRLSFPYVVLVLPFFSGALDRRRCQVFYRRKSLKSWEDKLLMTNLLNVAAFGEFVSYLSMGGYVQARGLSWQEAVEAAVRHFWWSEFHWGADRTFGISHFTAASNQRLDPAIISVEAWEEASSGSSRFMLEIPWPETGHTVLSAVQLAFSQMPAQAINLVNLVQDR